MADQSKKDHSFDPSAKTRIQEAVDKVPARGSRSKLTEWESAILDLRAKKYTYAFIREFLAEQAGCSAATSTIFEFVKAARKYRVKARRQSGSVTASLAPSLAQAASDPVRSDGKNPSTRDAIRAVKARPEAAEDRQDKKLFTFDPTKPLNSYSKPNTTNQTQP